MTEPIGGFANAAISTMFNPPVMSASPTTNTTTHHSQKGSNDRYIAGAVVGAVAGIALIAGLIFWILQRRSRRRGTTRQELPGESSTHKNDMMASYRGNSTQEMPNELPAQDMPVELCEDSNPAELPNKRGDRAAPTSPVELP